MPSPLPFTHPASLLATWFGSGLLPKAPGTWGSLAALPFAALISFLFGPWGLLVAAAIIFGIGIWASDLYASRSGTSDPGTVVVDEVAGQWLALFPVALDWTLYPVAFLAFRFFDIIKIWPANWMDQRLKGGFGIMADDIVAGIYAAMLCYGLTLSIG